MIDLATTAVQKGRQLADVKGLQRIIWEVGDIQTIAHRDETFDTVISCETIEHVPDPNHALSELARVLKHHGKLLLSTPNYLGYDGVISRLFADDWTPFHRSRSNH